jgi:hypothetical protein
MNTATRRHKLMTAELEKTLPSLYATDGQGDNAIVGVHYFSPYTGWDWYGIEYDPKTRTFFGWVNGHEGEYGYFGLDELETATLANGVPVVERDLYWKPVTLGEVK